MRLSASWAVALLLGALATGCAGDAEGLGANDSNRRPVVKTQGIPADLLAYRVGGDGRHLKIYFSRTSGERFQRAVVRERDEDVRVAVYLRLFGGMQDARVDCVSVRLGRSLGDRQVRSLRKGKRVPPREKFGPGFGLPCRPS